MYIGSLPTASTRAKYELPIQVRDAETDDLIDLTGFTIIFSIRDRCCAPILTATNDDGIDVADAAEGMFIVTFTPAQMRTLCAREYDVGCTITDDTDDEEVDQFIIGTLSVMDGVVS